MNRFQFLSIAFLFLAVAGCATTQNYEKVLDSWTGGDVNNLISSWGPPSDVYTMPDGREMYTWLFIGGSKASATYLPLFKTTVAQSTTYWCKTTFTVSHGIVQNWRYEGNACRSK